MTIPFHLGVRAHDFSQCPLPQLIEKLGEHSFSSIQFALHKSFPESAPRLSEMPSGRLASGLLFLAAM
jgi:L-ribulose-5-phosphate 3-epimerase